MTSQYKKEVEKARKFYEQARFRLKLKNIVKRKTLTAKRVVYGRTDTPVALREYRLVFGGPVGTKREWKAWAKEKGVKIKFEEAKRKH